MGIYTHVWLYRKTMPLLTKQNFVGSHPKAVIPHWALHKAMHYTILTDRRLTWLNLSHLWPCFGEAGDKRGCLCLKHKWLLHRNSCQVKLLKMSMEMKSRPPYTFRSKLASTSQTTFLLCQSQQSCSGPGSPQGAVTLEAHWLGVTKPHATQPPKTCSLSGVCHWSGPRWPCPWDISWHQLC